MTEPNYAAVVKRKHTQQQSNNLGYTSLNLGSDTNFVTTQTEESWPTLENGNFYNPEPVASLKIKTLK